MHMKALTLILFLFSCSALSAQNSMRTEHFNLEEEFAIQGYDPVAYFTQKKAIEGKKEYQYEFKGVPYRFMSTKNMETFKANPGMYEPAYGGWCAYAMSVTGDKVKIDPETFKIVDGKLNLFYNFFFNNTLKEWNKDEDKLKAIAITNWSRYYKE